MLGSPFIMLRMGSIRLDCVTSESCYKESVTGKSPSGSQFEDMTMLYPKACYNANSCMYIIMPILFIVVSTCPALSLPVQFTDLGTKATFCHNMFKYLHYKSMTKCMPPNI